MKRTGEGAFNPITKKRPEIQKQQSPEKFGEGRDHEPAIQGLQDVIRYHEASTLRPAEKGKEVQQMHLMVQVIRRTIPKEWNMHKKH